MATKEEVLQHIKALAEQKIVTKEELDEAFDSGNGIKKDAVSTKRVGVTEILCYIGGAIVFLGIAILLGQNWETLGFGTRVFATLGSSIIAYFAGLALSKNEKTETAGSAFYLISASVMPMGLWVVLDNAGFIGSSGSHALISGISLAVFLLSYVVLRKNIFALFCILFGTWFFFSSTSFMIGDLPYFDGWRFSEYRTLIVGIAYMLLGYSFSKNERAPLQGFLYSFGALGILGAAFALCGWEPSQNILWELIYPGVVFGILFLSVRIKNKASLMWGTLFLIAYILKITSEYFANSLGWPLALVIAGLAMIGAGYLFFSLKRKYLSA